MKFKPRARMRDLIDHSGFIRGIVAGIRCLILLTFTLAGGHSIQAQELRIVSIDSSAFPVLKAQIVYTGKKKFDASELFLSQDNRSIAYQINESSPGSAPVKGRALFFLVETSGLLYGNPLLEIKEGLLASLANLDAEDLINAASFGSYEVDSIGFNLLNKEFTTTHSVLRNAFNTRLSAISDSAGRSDLYHNIIKSLDYLGKTGSLPRHKLMVVISAGKNQSNFNETYSKTIERAKELGIPIHSITVLPNDSNDIVVKRMDNISRKTGGTSSTCKTQIEISNAITDILKLAAPQSMRDAYYDISFTAFDDLTPNSAKIELNYAGARQIFTAGIPMAETEITDDYKKYLWISIGILVLVLIIMVVVNLINRKKQSTTLDLNAPDDTEIKEKPDSSPIAESMVKPKIVVETVSKPTKINIDLPKQGGPVLLLSMNGRTASHTLDRDTTKIGRYDSNDIHINEQTVTGNHAVIKRTPNGFELEDLGSTNGTFVNGERIRKRVLISTDRIRFGNIEATVKL